MTEASDFKIGTQLGFAKAHNELPPGKKRVWPWAKGTPKYFFGFPFHIFGMAEASDFEFGLPVRPITISHLVTWVSRYGYGPGK